MSMSAKAVPTLQVDNARVRVTEWRLPPGSATGYHRHEMDYVIVPVKGDRMVAKGPAGEVSIDLVPGASYARPKGVEHDVINPGPSEVVFVEIELKD